MTTTQPSADRPTVTRLPLPVANAYLLQGARPILVDTGSPGDLPAIRRHLAAVGVALTDLALILLTHGHGDHAGSAATLQQAAGAPVAIHPADAWMLAAGRNDTLHPTSLEARLVKPFVDRPFPALQPDHLLDDSFDLAAYGVRAAVRHTPGHTAGSVSLHLARGDMLVGDLLMGGMMGGHIRSHVPAYHYFAADRTQLRASLADVVALAPQRLYVGHGGPLALADVVAFQQRSRASNLQPA